MVAGILYVSFHKHFDWFQYSIRSLEKFGSGFASVTVVVPEGDRTLFQPFCAAHNIHLRCYLELPGKEFLHHEVIKHEADIWLPRDTEVAVHLDSDCIFKEKFSLDTYLHNGKPILPREHFDDFRHYPSRYSWKRCVDYALGVDAQWETMTRHPSLYFIDLYKWTRDRVEEVHHFPFTQQVLYQKNSFPQSWAELPTLGNMALLAQPSRYQIVDFVHTPGKYWADPERAKLIGVTPEQVSNQPNPLLPDGHGNGGAVSEYWNGLGYGAKAVWYDDNGVPEVRPHPDNPMKYFWSHFGTDRFKSEIEALLA